MKLLIAIFAAGCFWGVQAKFDEVPGVYSTEVGYTGGSISNPSYELVCQNNTGHAEAVKIMYDPEKVSYEELLDVFFAIHDQTTKNRQGSDVGSQYRSAVFYIDEGQKQDALKKIRELDNAHVFKKPIVTEIVPASTFYPAEEYHQKYLFKKGRVSCSACASSVSVVSEKELKKSLSPEQYSVLREKATEAPFTGKYLYNKESGIYECAACGNPIFNSEDKFDSGSGWPSFDKALPGGIDLVPDNSHGMRRTEVICANCGSHLGHVFNDGPTETGERFCINSAAMDFDEEKD